MMLKLIKKITIKIEHLPIYSDHKILVKCTLCGKEMYLKTI